MQDPAKLRELARWYREFAERTGNPVIWDCRLRTADDLDAEAERLERDCARTSTQPPAQSDALVELLSHVQTAAR
jgi:hypothetical protein